MELRNPSLMVVEQEFKKDGSRDQSRMIKLPAMVSSTLAKA